MGTGPKPDPAFNSSDACEAACVDKDVSGVWRGCVTTNSKRVAIYLHAPI